MILTITVIKEDASVRTPRYLLLGTKWRVVPFTARGQEYERERILLEKDAEFVFYHTEFEVPAGQPGGDAQ